MANSCPKPDPFGYIGQDWEFAKKLRVLIEKEKKIVSKKRVLKGPILDLIKGWADYHDERNYMTPPLKSLARKHMLILGKVMEKDIPLDDARERLKVDYDRGAFFDYFAVAGHGHLMGNQERVISYALKKKFGEVPHVFNIVVLSNGTIDFEKLSCKDCSNARDYYGCAARNSCNGYNLGEYDHMRKQKDSDNQDLDGILAKHELKLSYPKN